MAKFEKIDRETAAKLFAKEEPKPSKREEWARQRAEYKEYLQSLADGEAGKMVLEPDDNRATIRTRLANAAKELGCALAFKRTRDNTLMFQIVRADEKPKRTRKKKAE